VAIAALVLLAIIFVPILFRSRPAPQDGDGLAIISNDGTTVAAGDEATTDETPLGDDTLDDPMLPQCSV